MFTTVCDFNSKLFRIEITESINIAQNLITNFYLIPCFRISVPSSILNIMQSFIKILTTTAIAYTSKRTRTIPTRRRTCTRTVCT